MGKIIVKGVVKRKPGFLYYIDAKGNVCEAKMSRGGKKKKKKKTVKKKTVKKKTVKKKTPGKKKTTKKKTTRKKKR